MQFSHGWHKVDEERGQKGEEMNCPSVWQDFALGCIEIDWNFAMLWIGQPQELSQKESTKGRKSSPKKHNT